MKNRRAKCIAQWHGAKGRRRRTHEERKPPSVPRPRIGGSPDAVRPSAHVPLPTEARRIFQHRGSDRRSTDLQAPSTPPTVAYGVYYEAMKSRVPIYNISRAAEAVQSTTWKCGVETTRSATTPHTLVAFVHVYKTGTCCLVDCCTAPPTCASIRG